MQTAILKDHSQTSFSNSCKCSISCNTSKWFSSNRVRRCTIGISKVLICHSRAIKCTWKNSCSRISSKELRWVESGCKAHRRTSLTCSRRAWARRVCKSVWISRVQMMHMRGRRVKMINNRKYRLRNQMRRLWHLRRVRQTQKQRIQTIRRRCWLGLSAIKSTLKE